MISSPASVDELSVPFNSILPSPVSSLNKILSRASDASVSVPSLPRARAHCVPVLREGQDGIGAEEESRVQAASGHARAGQTVEAFTRP